tara:strand:- start:591 stop:1121 length:531 start_codon:yes stop_codon:yes gene_type:complete
MKYISLFSILFISLVQFSKAQHTLVLNSGEKIEGVVIELQNDIWTMVVDGKEKKVQMKEVSSVFFKEYVPYDGTYIPDTKEEVLEVDGFTVKYQLKDRKLIKNPELSIGSEDHGTVVVKITVDKYGNVRTAEPGASGSTTSSNYLYVKAQRAAKSAKFNEYLKGPIMTEGTITIVY